MSNDLNISITSDTHQLAFPTLLGWLMKHGEVHSSRNGKVRELYNVKVQVKNPWPPHINYEDRKASLPSQLAETLWVLAGRNDVDWLSDYLPRARDFSDDGETWRGGYGPRIRNWGGVDQLEHVINLLNTDPDTRRAVMSIYDPAIDTEPGKDIPCNNMLYFSKRDGILHLSVTARSNDIWWGWSGINTFEWSTLLALVAHLTDSDIGSITYFIANLHIYGHHWEKANRLLENQKISDSKWPGLHWVYSAVKSSWAKGNVFTGMNSLEEFDQEVSTLFGDLEEDVLTDSVALPPFFDTAGSILTAFLNRRDDGSMETPEIITRERMKEGGEALVKAFDFSPRMKPRVVEPAEPNLGPKREAYVRELSELHRRKSEGYGDSWRRRGETIGILANEARKIDRLVLGSDDDIETLEDTATDLLIYLVKHRIWLSFDQDRSASDDPAEVEKLLREYVGRDEAQKSRTGWGVVESIASIANRLDTQFGSLSGQVAQVDPWRFNTVDNMIHDALTISYRLWSKRRGEELREANSTRRFNGYATTEEEE